MPIFFKRTKIKMQQEMMKLSESKHEIMFFIIVSEQIHHSTAFCVFGQIYVSETQNAQVDVSLYLIYCRILKVMTLITFSFSSPWMRLLLGDHYFQWVVTFGYQIFFLNVKK